MDGPRNLRGRRADHALYQRDLRPGAARADGRGHERRLAGDRSRPEPGHDVVTLESARAARTHPQDLSLRDQVAGIAGGDIDAGELLQATLERIEERNPAINAIV